MNTTVQHPVLGQISYDENMWSGKVSITINHVPLQKIKKRQFQYNTPEGSFPVTVKGNWANGLTLNVKGEEITLIKKPEWYVLAFSIFMFALVLIWGNIPSLFAILPMVSGAIGGAVSAMYGLLNITICRKTQNPMMKLLICLGFLAATILTCFFLAVVLIGLL